MVPVMSPQHTDDLCTYKKTTLASGTSCNSERSHQASQPSSCRVLSQDVCFSHETREAGAGLCAACRPAAQARVSLLQHGEEELCGVERLRRDGAQVPLQVRDRARQAEQAQDQEVRAAVGGVRAGDALDARVHEPRPSAEATPVPGQVGAERVVAVRVVSSRGGGESSLIPTRPKFSPATPQAVKAFRIDERLELELCISDCNLD